MLALVKLGDAVVPGIAGGPYDELRIGDEVEVELRPNDEVGLTLVHFRRG